MAEEKKTKGRPKKEVESKEENKLFKEVIDNKKEELEQDEEIVEIGKEVQAGEETLSESEKEYKELFDSYTEIQGVYPNSEWTIEELKSELEKLTKGDSKKEELEQIVEAKNIKPEKVTDTSGLICLTHVITKQRVYVTPGTYRLVKSNKDYTAEVDLPELKNK